MKITLFLAVLIIRVISDTPVSLNGDGFVSFDLKSIRSSPRQSSLSLRFRTIYPNGLLVYSKGTMGHYLQMEIVQGRLQ